MCCPPLCVGLVHALPILWPRAEWPRLENPMAFPCAHSHPGGISVRARALLYFVLPPRLPRITARNDRQPGACRFLSGLQEAGWPRILDTETFYRRPGGPWGCCWRPPACFERWVVDGFSTAQRPALAGSARRLPASAPPAGSDYALTVFVRRGFDGPLASSPVRTVSLPTF